MSLAIDDGFLNRLFHHDAIDRKDFAEIFKNGERGLVFDGLGKIFFLDGIVDVFFQIIADGFHQHFFELFGVGLEVPFIQLDKFQQFRGVCPIDHSDGGFQFFGSVPIKSLDKNLEFVRILFVLFYQCRLRRQIDFLIDGGFDGIQCIFRQNI